MRRRRRRKRRNDWTARGVKAHWAKIHVGPANVRNIGKRKRLGTAISGHRDWLATQN